MTAAAVWWATLCSAAAALLVIPPRPRLRPPAPGATAPGRRGRRLRWRLLTAILVGAGVAGVLPGPVGWLAGPGAAAAAWAVLGRVEDPTLTRERTRAQRDLGHLVELLGAALAAGCPPGEAVGVVCAALPGPAADRLRGVRARLDLGVDPERVWTALTEDPVLAPVGRAMARAQASGAPVAAAMARLADDLRLRARSDVEDRARAVGVKAALPLGLCLLPAFLLLGIVPVVAGMLMTLLP